MQSSRQELTQWLSGKSLQIRGGQPWWRGIVTAGAACCKSAHPRSTLKDCSLSPPSGHASATIKANRKPARNWAMCAVLLGQGVGWELSFPTHWKGWRELLHTFTALQSTTPCCNTQRFAVLLCSRAHFHNTALGGSNTSIIAGSRLQLPQISFARKRSVLPTLASTFQ